MYENGSSCDSFLLFIGHRCSSNSIMPLLHWISNKLFKKIPQNILHSRFPYPVANRYITKGIMLFGVCFIFDCSMHPLSERYTIIWINWSMKETNNRHKSQLHFERFFFFRKKYQEIFINQLNNNWHVIRFGIVPFDWIVHN